MEELEYLPPCLKRIAGEQQGAIVEPHERDARVRVRDATVRR